MKAPFQLILLIFSVLAFYSTQAQYKLTYEAVYKQTRVKSAIEELYVYTSSKSIRCFSKNYYLTNASPVTHSREDESTTIIVAPKQFHFTLYPFYVQRNKDADFSKVTYNIIGKNYQFKVPKRLDWQLSNDTTRIGKFICHKAEAMYEGRRFVAWYAPEVPIPEGPYVFNGLPGLIIQLYDTQKVYEFTLKELSKSADDQADILEKHHKERGKPISLTLSEFRDIVKRFRENPIVFRNSQGETRILAINGKSVQSLPPRRMPFPTIEKIGEE